MLKLYKYRGNIQKDGLTKYDMIAFIKMRDRYDTQYSEYQIAGSLQDQKNQQEEYSCRFRRLSCRR